jgi:hypothetical protein
VRAEAVRAEAARVREEAVRAARVREEAVRAEAARVREEAVREEAVRVRKERRAKPVGEKAVSGVERGDGLRERVGVEGANTQYLAAPILSRRSPLHTGSRKSRAMES